MKSQEIRNLKAVAQIILDQRSDTEQFFLEAIDFVKEEARKRSVQNSAKHKSRFPDLITKEKPDQKSKLNPEKLDFNSLSWEDKEKILRILFSKMNAGMPPKDWRTQQHGISPINQKADKSLDDVGAFEHNKPISLNPDN